MREVILKGLTRAMIVYLLIFQELEPRHLRTHVTVGTLLENFALGVLGLRFDFLFSVALKQHERAIEKFVQGIFNQPASQSHRQFTRDNLDDFKLHYRDSIITAARKAEDEYYKNFTLQREEQARRNALFAMMSANHPTSNVPSPTMTLNRATPPHTNPVATSQDENASRQNPNLSSPAHGGRVNYDPLLMRTPLTNQNTVDRPTTLRLNHQVDSA